MKIKRDNIPSRLWIAYKESLIDKVFKILPMKEEKCVTLSTYIDSLLFEIFGMEALIEDLKDCGEFLSIMFIIKYLSIEEDVLIVRREVFKCIDLIKKI